VWTESHDRGGGGGIALPRDEFVEKRRSEVVLASQQWKESGEMGVADLERIQSGR
jgi:hypothetical protein